MAEEKKWTNQICGATCREPYKTELDRLANRWIKGSLSNEKLAVELWSVMSGLRLFETTNFEKRLAIQPWKPDLKVRAEIERLGHVALLATKHPSGTPKERRQLLEETSERWHLMYDGPAR